MEDHSHFGVKKDVKLFVSNVSEHCKIELLASLCNSKLSSLMDKYAPIFRKAVTRRPVTPWFDQEVEEDRQV